MENGYLTIDRQWSAGDKIEISFPMMVKRMYAHPDVKEDVGMVALQRGPVVYCLEQVDNPVQPHKAALPEDAEFEAKFEPDLLGGVVTIQAESQCWVDDDWGDALYRDTPPETRPLTVKAVPYYAWDNRDPGWMRVWIRNS